MQLQVKTYWLYVFKKEMIPFGKPSRALLHCTQYVVCVGLMDWRLCWEVAGGRFKKEIIFAQS